MPEPSRRRLIEPFAPFRFLSACRPADAPRTAPPARRQPARASRCSVFRTIAHDPSHPVACYFGGGSPGLAPLAKITVPRSGGAARRQGGAALSVKLPNPRTASAAAKKSRGTVSFSRQLGVSYTTKASVAAPQTRCKPGRGLNAGGKGRRPAGRGVESAKIAVPAQRIRSFPYPRKKFGTLESCPHFEALRTAHAARSQRSDKNKLRGACAAWLPLRNLGPAQWVRALYAPPGSRCSVTHVPSGRPGRCAAWRVPRR